MTEITGDSEITKKAIFASGRGIGRAAQQGFLLSRFIPEPDSNIIALMMSSIICHGFRGGLSSAFNNL